MKVRGAGYLKKKAKVESAAALFDFAGCDAFLCESGPMMDVASRMHLPPLTSSSAFGDGEGGGGGGGVAAAAWGAGSAGESGGGGGVRYDPGYDPAGSVPAYIVVNLQIPTVGKALFGAKKKAAAAGPPPTIMAVYYFKITPATAAGIATLDRLERGGKVKTTRVCAPSLCFTPWCHVQPLRVHVEDVHS